MDTKQIRVAVKRLIEQYPDAQRHALVAESRDWDQIITPALEAWGSMVPIHPDLQKAMLQWHLHNALNGMVQAIYAMGYERGKREVQVERLEFVVAEDAEA